MILFAGIRGATIIHQHGVLQFVGMKLHPLTENVFCCLYTFMELGLGRSFECFVGSKVK